MAGEAQAADTTQQGGATPQTDNQPNGAPSGTATETTGILAQTGAPGKVEELPDWAQQLVKDLRRENAARRKAEDEQAKARTEAERKAAEEQGEFRKLYEAERVKAQAAEQRAREWELAGLRRDAAAKHGLPATLAERLRGESAEELDQDAKAVAAALPKPTAPNINATGGGASHAAADDDALTAQAIRLGIRPDLYKQNYKGI